MFRWSGFKTRMFSEAGTLAWVDEFIENIRPYVFVRTYDDVLIKRPNQVAKLNKSAALILKYLLDGGNIRRVVRRIGMQKEKIQELESFFRAMKAYLSEGIDPLFPPSGVEIVPFEMNFTSLPVLSEIALHYDCNLHCRFCYAGERQPASSPPSNAIMRPHEVKKVLEILYRVAQVPSVSFTGGEPTLIPELFSYIRYAKKLGMRVNLITNGALIDAAYARKLRGAGLDSAQVSLEGVRAETHNRLVGRPVFGLVVEAVRHLAEAGIHTHTNTTLNQANLGEILDFPAFVKESLGLPRFSMNLMIPVGAGSDQPDLTVSYSEVGPHLEKLRTESERLGLEFMWYSPVPMCLFNSVLHGLDNKGCSACDGLISIAPDGTVRPCAAYPESVGHLLRDGFERIWESQRASQIRRKALAYEPCLDCEDFAICNGACPLYFQQQGYRELQIARFQELP